jgi:hypothetical protein
VSQGSTDETLQRRRINLVAFVDIDGTPLIACKAGIEELAGIGKARALGESHFHLVLVRVGYRNEPIVRPARAAHPFPFFDDLGVSVMNYFAKSGKHFAAPVRKACD